MNKVFTALAAGFVALSAPTLALAQATDPDAVAQAASQQACGEASVIRAIFLDDERIQVTCRGAVGTNPSALGGTGLTTTQIAAGVAAVLVIAVIAGDDDNGTSTTTTTTTN